MTKDEMRARGWHTWYHNDCWVHPDSVGDSKSQDYTNYGFRFEDAVKYELLGKPPFQLMGMPAISKMDMAIRTKGLTQVADGIETTPGRMR